jgi:Zn-finger nucleic acid-binding protein
MTTLKDLVCPKCGGLMRTYERSEILVKQCEDCRGIFLDRGELERLVDAEGGGWSGRVAEPAGRNEDRAGKAREGRSDGERDGRSDGERDGRPDPRDGRTPRKESRLGGIFDLFGGD